MSGLAKLALDAMKAREMARGLGIVPQGDWKWALRQLRDGRGDPLTGQALGKAKEGIGKMPNNLKQQMTSLAQRAGGDKEVALALKKDGPSMAELAQTTSTDRSQLKNYGNQFREELAEQGQGNLSDDEITEFFGTPHGPFRVGAKTYAAMALPSEMTAGQIAGSAHTHPNIPFFGKMQALAQGRFLGAMAEVPDMPAGVARQRKKMLADLDRMNATDYRRAMPSGHLTRWEERDVPKGFGMTAKDMTGGDYRFFLDAAEHHPNARHNIVDPVNGYESTHQLRSQGRLRSIYFHREGR